MAPLDRRRLLQTGLGALALNACAPAPPSASPRPRPNILFVIADDQSWPHASIYGSRASQTPAFDRVAREGALFTNSFCASPSCTPSRSAILTGRNIWQIGEAGILYGTIGAQEILFPHLLADAGYFCGFTGKGWGPGDWSAGGLTRHPIGKEYNARKHDESSLPARGLDVRDTAANFEDFLKDRPAAAPFFFWLGSLEPHRVYDPGAAVRAGRDPASVAVPAFLPDTPEIRSDLLDYHAEIDWYDRQLARALAALEKTGELDNTLIIVTSDNGMPFPRAKVNLYDAGTHMPLAIRWGKRLKPGQRIGDLASHTDFAPTILAAAGVPVPAAMDGRNLVPEPEAAPPQPSREFIYTALERHTYCRPGGATYPMRAIRSKEYLYIRNFAPDRWPTGGPEFTSSNKTFHGDVDGAPVKDFMTLPANQRKFAREYALAFGKRPAEEFYDVAADPGQLRNLAAGPTAAADPQLARHREALEAYLRKTQDPRIEGKDPWQAYPYRQTTGYGAQFNTALNPGLRNQAAGAAAHKPE